MNRIGVLALQGDFSEHIHMLQKIPNVIPVEVRNKEDLASVDGLIIPGGESTSMGIIAQRSGLLDDLKQFTQIKPTWGTCAGMIFLSNKLVHEKIGGQPTIGGLDVVVDRNHFGSQLQSFEMDLNVPQLGSQPIHAIFIRAPVAVSVGPKVDEVLAKLSDNEIIAFRQGRILATSFHPELSQDVRWHKYFVELVEKSKKQ